MADESTKSSVHLTFSKRHGYEPLPKPMQLENISGNLRRAILNTLRELSLEICGNFGEGPYFASTEQRFLERVLGEFFKCYEGQISTDYDEVMEICERVIIKSEFNKVLDFLETMLNDKYVMTGHTLFVKKVKHLFEQHVAAYWLDVSQQPYQFSPQCSESQGKATREAIEVLSKNNMDGSATHLRQAVEHINAQQYADSIVDSIHAVESAACLIDPGASKTLGAA